MLPRLSRVHGITWDHIRRMPYGELDAYLDDLWNGPPAQIQLIVR